MTAGHYNTNVDDIVAVLMRLGDAGGVGIGDLVDLPGRSNPGVVIRANETHAWVSVYSTDSDTVEVGQFALSSLNLSSRQPRSVRWLPGETIGLSSPLDHYGPVTVRGYWRHSTYGLVAQVIAEEDGRSIAPVRAGHMCALPAPVFDVAPSGPRTVHTGGSWEGLCSATPDEIRRLSGAPTPPWRFAP